MQAGGGIEPDHVVYLEAQSRLRMVLDASASFTSFATEYVRKHQPFPQTLRITSPLLDDFQVYLSQRNIRPGISDWSAERGWIESRLEQEILNQGVGVAKGDEVEVRRDPQVLMALEVLGER